MSYSEIGKQLRAFRLETGLRAEDIASQIGISRAALYRYEKGEVIKLDTIQKLADLLKTSPHNLLGIDTGYFTDLAEFLEYLLNLEAKADQILHIDGPLCYAVTTPLYDQTLKAVHAELLENYTGNKDELRSVLERIQKVLALRKTAYKDQRPNIIGIIPISAIRFFLERGIAGSIPVSPALRRQCQLTARAELENIAELIDSEPIGLQFGVYTESEMQSSFLLLRAQKKTYLMNHPLRADSNPATLPRICTTGTGTEVIEAHYKVYDSLWKTALKSTAASACLRKLLAEYNEAEYKEHKPKATEEKGTEEHVYEPEMLLM